MVVMLSSPVVERKADVAMNTIGVTRSMVARPSVGSTCVGSPSFRFFVVRCSFHLCC